MARFCTHCGSPAEESLKFCPQCGTQLSAPTPPVAAAPASTRPAAPVAAGAPAAAPAKSGSPILKIILALIGFFVLVSMLGIGACVYVAYKARQKAAQFTEAARRSAPSFGTPEIRMEKGGKGSEAAASATQDVPPYPGSTPTQGGGELSAGGLGGISGQEFETSDPTEKVVAFYKDKFGSKINIELSEGNARFTLVTSSGVTTVQVTRDEDAGKTRIRISRIGR